MGGFDGECMKRKLKANLIGGNNSGLRQGRDFTSHFDFSFRNWFLLTRLILRLNNWMFWNHCNDCASTRTFILTSHFRWRRLFKHQPIPQLSFHARTIFCFRLKMPILLDFGSIQVLKLMLSRKPRPFQNDAITQNSWKKSRIGVEQAFECIIVVSVAQTCTFRKTWNYERIWRTTKGKSWPHSKFVIVSFRAFTYSLHCLIIR